MTAAAVTTSGLLLLWVLAAAGRPLVPADLLAFDEVAEIEVSPADGTIFFTVTSAELEGNRTTVRLQRLRPAGGEAADVTGAPDGVSSLRVSPDGTRLAFFARRDGHDALWVLDL